MNEIHRIFAARFAKRIEDHERRDDCGGTYHQAWSDFKEVVWTNRDDVSGFQMPNGEITKDGRAAVTAWSGETNGR